jgi:DNA-binding transcriptional ArsR family regulator
MVYYSDMDKFSALADPTRRKIIEMLSVAGQMASTEISDQFPMSAPAISQHLKVLHQAKLVTVERRAQQRIYRVNPKTLGEVELWARRLRTIWDDRFDQIEQLLKEQDYKENNDEQE